MTTCIIATNGPFHTWRHVGANIVNCECGAEGRVFENEDVHGGYRPVGPDDHDAPHLYPVPPPRPEGT